MNSLGIDKAPAQTRVVAAMSGGVDSAVVAALLAGEGYDVVGVTLQLYDHGSAVGRKGACCAGQDIHDARRIADRLGIPHYVLDYEARFRAAVMDDFAATYARGETPIPCVRCGSSSATCWKPPASWVPMPWPPATTRGASTDRTGRSCTRRPIRGATKAISCSPPRPSSWPPCAFPWAARRRRRPGPWPAVWA
jgi:hypothetical protein